MKAGVWEEVGVLACAERERPVPRADQVLVEVAYCGFCGSDRHFVEGRFDIGPPPQILGHEVAGTVIEVGSEVEPDLVGARVACNPVAVCGACAFCRDGRPTHCSRQRFSTRGFAEFALYRPQQVFVLPSSVSLLEGAFLEPAATSLRATELAALAPGENVLVIGGGALGQQVATAARIAGAGSVVISEPRPSNRELALSRGADLAVDPTTENLTEVARMIGPRGGFDVVFEVAGSLPALEAAPALACRGGRVVVMGVVMPEAEAQFRPGDLNQREVSILGSYGGTGCFERAIPLLGRFDVESLVTEIAPLEEIDRLYASIVAGEQIKALVNP